MGARGSQDKEWLDRLLGGNGRWFARWLLTQNALNGGATERNASLANLRRERSYCDIQVDDVQAAVVTKIAHGIGERGFQAAGNGLGRPTPLSKESKVAQSVEHIQSGQHQSRLAFCSKEVKKGRDSSTQTLIGCML